MNDKKEKVEVVEKDYLGRAKGIFASIREHLSDEYRKQYNIRRVFGCILLFIILRYLTTDSLDTSVLSTNSIIPFIWSSIAFLFWHYAFWAFQGGIIDTFSKNLIHFGSIWGLIWKVIVQNVFILIWIAFIAPASGIKTWRKAVKNNKILFVSNDKDNVWK